MVTIVFPFLSCVGPAGRNDLPAAGVALALAEQRAMTITNVVYDLHFHVPADSRQAVTGSLLAGFDLSDASRPLVLDFRVPSDHVLDVTLNGGAVAHTVAADHIIIPADALEPGPQSLRVEFRSADTALNRRDEFMYALFVPDRASTAFPVFEQPDIKARYRLQLSVPEHWQALSNGAELGREPDPELPATDRIRFAETLPISSYLFAFAAGDLKTETAVRDGRTFTLYHRETDPERLARNRDAIFDLHATALDWLEDYTDIDYPFGKFDFFAIPAFQFGGMEHPGAIWYRAETLFLDPSASRTQELSRASLIAHETAHMWFGDLVTMRWFNDVWMKEVFANFMAAKIAGPAFPELDLDLRFFQAHHPAAYAVDRTAGANPVRQQLGNLRDAGSLYGAIIYQKAPIVMQQLETLLGEDVLRDGLRQYLTQYAFDNASWPDLISLLDAMSTEDLTAWSRTWVDEPGRPRIQAHWQDSGITVSQIDDNTGRDLLWQQPVVLAVGRDGLVTEHVAQLRGRHVTVAMPPGLSDKAPDFILAGADGVGYARFELDDSSRQFLLANVHGLDSGLHRAVVWQNLWEDLLEDSLDPLAFHDALLVGVTREQDPLIAQQVLGLLRSVWWRYLSEEQRQVRARSQEDALWQALARANGAGRKGPYFNAIVDVTSTESGVAELAAIWHMRREIEGLPLQEQQYIDLAEALALRGVPEADAILDMQQARISNPDRLDRFEFVRPALSQDPDRRAEFFLSFAALENRRQESWVLDATRFVHHPLRADTAIPLIRPALMLLEDIQQTGDIFFPLRWLNATLDGHSSAQAAAIVQRYLNERTDMQPQLRAKLLQAADSLLRAAR
ncbi:MAG: M1 family aminopeptidase [Pseudohongiella sp.]|uniref:M1 family aminopeptidase n=1 Tax=Pseudohongiella sp. TaxID=1979412 RepID=UPI0034A08516